MVQPAYAELLRRVSASKGIALDRAFFEGVLRSAILADLSQEASVTVWIHNWTKETFDPPADYELDWTADFDRSSRRVPSSDVWNKDLVPQLDRSDERRVGKKCGRTCSSGWAAYPLKKK